MSLKKLVVRATDKKCFSKIEDFVDFALAILDFAASGLQAVIVSRNEPHYNFWQFKSDGSYNISRPINSSLMYSAADASEAFKRLVPLLPSIRETGKDMALNREVLNRAIYTLQQCIGIALDGLPAGKSNTARKINGDLFERLIQLTLVRAQVPCTCSPASVRAGLVHGPWSTQSVYCALVTSVASRKYGVRYTRCHARSEISSTRQMALVPSKRPQGSSA